MTVLNNVVQENLQGIPCGQVLRQRRAARRTFDEVSNDVYRNFTLAQTNRLVQYAFDAILGL